MKELGTIKVEWHHMWKQEPYPRQISSAVKGHVAVTSVSEKAIKGQAISHSVGYVDSCHSAPRDTTNLKKTF